MKKSLGLFLDTSSKTPFAALICEGSLIATFTQCSEKSSSHFAKHVKEFLESNQVSMQSLNYLCVGTGPGSFIGTRVAVIIAKALAFGLQIPLLHFSSLVGYSITQDGPFAILSDAKSKGFYALFGQKIHESIQFDASPILIEDAQLADLRVNRHLFAIDYDCLSQKKSISNLDISLTCFDDHHIAKHCHDLYLDYLKEPQTLTPPEIFYLRLS